MVDDLYQVRYSSRARGWLHSRVPSGSSKLYPIRADFPTALPPSRITHDLTNPPGPENPRVPWSRYIAQDAPEAAPALDFLGPYLEESNLILSETENFDPVMNKLLSFGKATNNSFEEKKSRYVNVAAWAMGPVGGDVGIGLLGERRMREEGRKGGRDVLVPKIIVGDECTPAWSFVAPVRQLRFAGGMGDMGRPLLAIRIPAATTFFRSSRDYASPTSSCSLKELLSIPADEIPHADVDFNPWYDQQCALIDENGGWKLYDLEIKRFKTCFRVKEFASGTLYTSADEPGSELNGWGRITWGADVNTLVAAGRKRLALFDVREKGNRSVLEGIVDTDSWILDICSGVEPGKSVWALTDKTVEWVDLRMRRRLRSVKHWRHREDRTLALEVFKGVEDITNVLVYSRRNFLTSSYRFSETVQGQQFATIIGDPYIFANPSPSNIAETENIPLNISVLPCGTKNFKPFSGEEGAGPEPNDGLFFTAFNINRQLSVSQRLYCTKQKEEKLVPVLSYEQQRILRRQAKYKSERYVVDSGSEIPSPGGGSEIEESETDKEIGTDKKSGTDKEPGTDEESEIDEKSEIKSSHRRTNFSSLYKYAYIDGDGSLRPPRMANGELEYSVSDYIQSLESNLRGIMEEGLLGISVLTEVENPKYLFDDLGKLSERLQSLLEEESIAKGYELKTLLPTKDDLATMKLEDIYNNLLETYLYPLPLDVPGKLRLRRERICRLMATEIYLSTRGISLKPSPEQLKNLIPKAPVRGTSFSGLAAGDLEEERNENLLKLRTLTSVKGRIQLPPRFQAILDTWEVGVDPDEFEFSVNDLGETTMERKKMDKGKGKAVDNGSFNAFGGSQPPQLQISTAPAGSSSARSEGSQIVSINEAERGKFGGRPRKKRRPGF